MVHWEEVERFIKITKILVALLAHNNIFFIIFYIIRWSVFSKVHVYNVNFTKHTNRLDGTYGTFSIRTNIFYVPS